MNGTGTGTLVFTMSETVIEALVRSGEIAAVLEYLIERGVTFT